MFLSYSLSIRSEKERSVMNDVQNVLSPERAGQNRTGQGRTGQAAISVQGEAGAHVRVWGLSPGDSSKRVIGTLELCPSDSLRKKSI